VGNAPIFSSRTARDGTPHFTNTLLLGAANTKPAPDDMGRLRRCPVAYATGKQRLNTIEK